MKSIEGLYISERSLSMCNGGWVVEAIWGRGGHEAKSFFLSGALTQFYKKQRGFKQKYIYRVYKQLRQVCIFNSCTRPLSQIEYLALARINCYKSEHFPKTEANINVNMWYVYSTKQLPYSAAFITGFSSDSDWTTTQLELLGSPLAEALADSPHFIYIILGSLKLLFYLFNQAIGKT